MLDKISNMFKKAGRHRNFDAILFAAILFTGIVCSFFLRSYLASLPYQSGEQALGLFIPPFLTAIYFSVIGTEKGFSKKLLLKSVLLFVLQIAPFGNLLFKETAPNPGEDFDRYFQYAEYMVANKTLAGGDQLFYKDYGLSYITQPGLRYLIAGELLAFGKLYRFVSVLHILVFISSLFLFLNALQQLTASNKIMALLSLLFVLTVPFATKNILMGMPEWLTVMLLMLSVYFFVCRKNMTAAIILLALVPFIRQNILPPVLLFLLFYLRDSRHKLMLTILFLAVLLLPLYHNLYYAGEFRFFTSIDHWPFLKYDTTKTTALGFNFTKMLNNLSHYAGIDFFRKKTPDFIEDSFTWLWLFCFVYFYCGWKLKIQQLRIFYFFSSFTLIILPAVLFATHFYPRFEFVVVYFVITLFALLYQLQQKNPAMRGWNIFNRLKN